MVARILKEKNLRQRHVALPPVRKLLLKNIREELANDN
jgi:hypothetical protein